MAVMQKDVNAAYFKGARSYKVKSEKVTQEVSMPPISDAQDDHLWECAIANNIDAIRDLADKALADRRAGRTKKITL